MSDSSPTSTAADERAAPAAGTGLVPAADAPGSTPGGAGGLSVDDEWARVLVAVERRLCRRGFWRRMLASAPWVAGVVLMLLVARVLTGSPWAGALVPVVLAVWPGMAFALSRWREPRGFEALACWDRHAGRKESLASGYWFATRGHGGVGEELHCQRSRAMLRPAMAGLGAELPLPTGRRRVLWVPLLVLGLLLPVWREAGVEAGPRLTDGMRAAAAERAEQLRKQDFGFDRFEGLDTDEREALQRLEEEVRRAAELLARGDDVGARELLEELEARAESAEDLARQIGGDRGGWASEALIGEMRRHADTADLADMLHDQAAGEAATEADRLVEVLNADPMSDDVVDRLTASMRRIGDAASEQDPDLLAGRHLVRATDEFQQQPRPRQAAGHFEALAHDLREVARRDRARDELEDLASQLREAGSDILGGGGEELQRMETPAGDGDGRDQGGLDPEAMAAAPEGMQPLGGEMSDALNRLLEQDAEIGQASPGASPSGESRDVQMSEGTGTAELGEGGGEGQEGDGDGAMAMAPGDGAGGEGAPLLMAPIPGQGPDGGDSAGAGMVAAGGAGDTPAAGGQEPGTGSAPLGDAELPPGQEASGESVVRIDPATPGASTLRAVEGREREEQAGRERHQITIDRLRAEEQALDDLALPLSRRQEVRRYFHRLRESFE